MPKITKPEQVRLSNGIPVVFQKTDGGVAATYWWNNVGSADEIGDEAGYAHFLEHMLFKDSGAKETGQSSTGKTAREIESLGGDINAYTSFDQTVYHVTCAAHQWEHVIDVFGKMAKPQKFLKTDFEREREVILEELRKNEDSPQRQLFQRLFSATFRKHSYGKPVIGFVKTLNKATVKSLENFYQRHYISDKMGLILAGPYDEARKTKLIAQLEKYFGKSVIKAKAAKVVGRTFDRELEKTFSIETLAFDVKSPTICVSFRVPDLKHVDVAALDVVSNVLAQGELSRLYQGLFYGSSLATDVNGGVYIPRDPGMLYFSAETDDMKKLNQLTEKLFSIIEDLKTTGPKLEELERVIVNAESEKLYSTQTADGLASRVAFMKFIVGDLTYDREYLEDLRALESEDIKEVAKKYLIPERMGIVLLLPKDQKKFDLTAIKEAAKQLTGLKTGSAAAPKNVRSFQKVVSHSSGSKKSVIGRIPYAEIRPSGIRLLHLERPQSHVFSVHAASLGGLRLELAHPIDSAEKDWGLSHLMAMTWSKGTEKLKANEISAIVEGKAASLEGYSGRNTVGLHLTGLTREWQSLSGLFSEVLTEPTFVADELEHSKRVVEDSIRSLEDHTAQLCSKLFLETLFEEHPYGQLTVGSLESIKGIDTQKLLQYHKHWVRPEQTVLTVVGAVRRAELLNFVEGLEKQWGVSPIGQSAPKSESDLLVAPEPKLKAPRWIEKNLGREQTHIIVGGIGATMTSDDRFALKILQTLLGGQSGRLFIELREKKSLAYTVAPLCFEGIEPGYIGTYIACAPTKKDEAIQGIRTVLETLASKGPQKSEMKRAKEFYLGRRAMDLQSDTSLAAHYGLETLYGLPLLRDDELIEQINAVTEKQVADVCRKYLVEPHQVTAIVG